MGSRGKRESRTVTRSGGDTCNLEKLIDKIRFVRDTLLGLLI